MRLEVLFKDHNRQTQLQKSRGELESIYIYNKPNDNRSTTIHLALLIATFKILFSKDILHFICPAVPGPNARRVTGDSVLGQKG